MVWIVWWVLAIAILRLGQRQLEKVGQGSLHSEHGRVQAHWLWRGEPPRQDAGQRLQRARGTTPTENTGRQRGVRESRNHQRKLSIIPVSAVFFQVFVGCSHMNTRSTRWSPTHAKILEELEEAIEAMGSKEDLTEFKRRIGEEAERIQNAQQTTKCGRATQRSYGD